MSLSVASITIVKATAPLVKENATAITERFYRIMFDNYPEVHPYFNMSNQESGTQAKALANAVVMYALNIEKLHNMGPVVKQIVAKHVALDIQVAHYDIVGTCLLQGIKEILGDPITPEVTAAWAEAYQFLAQILIDAEEDIYVANAASLGGWRGSREFVVDRIDKESEVISSFYLKPADGGALMPFKAGQYTCLLANVNGEEIRRNYSLSDAPNKPYYRISVKRESHGQMSNYLHKQVNVGDSVRLLAPSGEFVLSETNRPLMLVTGGVGITPAISMLNDVVASGRKVDFIHAAISGDTHAFKEHVDELAKQYKNVTPHYVYNEPKEHDTPHETGFISEQLLGQKLPADKNVDFYFLGPKPFMAAMRNLARSLGINDENVKYEFFGPLEDI